MHPRTASLAFSSASDNSALPLARTDSEIPPSEYYPEGYHPELLEEWPAEGDLVVPVEIAPELVEALEAHL